MLERLTQRHVGATLASLLEDAEDDGTDYAICSVAFGEARGAYAVAVNDRDMFLGLI